MKSVSGVWKAMSERIPVGVGMRSEAKSERLMQVLMLVLDNGNLSAGSLSFEKWAENRREAIEILLELFNLTEDQADDLYLTWINEREKAKGFQKVRGGQNA